MGVIARIDASDRVEVYARGFRNVYGISVAPDGTIYGADNDEEDGLTTTGHLEELNGIQEGAFYGYPVYGTNEAPSDKNITEPVAILQGFGSTATYANEDGVYVAYVYAGETVRHVVDRFDYETFSATRIYGDKEYYTNILEQDDLLYLLSLAGNIHVIDPDAAPVSIGSRLSSAELRQMLASPPVITSEYYNVYLDDSLDEVRIIYVKNSCMREENSFVLHVYPIRNNDLPMESRVHGFENLDFSFDRYGWIEDNMCIAMRYLPSYEIDYFVVGQYSVNENIWSQQLSLPSSFYLTSSDLDEIVASEPMVYSEYNIHLHNSHLVYIGESCADEETMFSLHVYPVRVDDLPVDRKPSGFENLDFSLDRYSWIKDDMCVVMRPLPSYDIEYLVLGQFNIVEENDTKTFNTIWEKRVYFPPVLLISEGITRIMASDPVIYSEYNVYLDDSKIIYLRTECEDEDRLFSLHIYPVRIDDLPHDRRSHEFDNLDFAFADYGKVGNGMCVAVRYLPDYDIASLTTGQYTVREVDGQATFETVWTEDLSFQE